MKKEKELSSEQKRRLLKQAAELKRTAQYLHYTGISSVALGIVLIICAVLDAEYYPEGNFAKMWNNAIGFAKITIFLYPPALLSIFGVACFVVWFICSEYRRKYNFKAWQIKEDAEPGAVTTILQTALEELGNYVTSEYEKQEAEKKRTDHLFENPEKYR